MINRTMRFRADLTVEAVPGDGIFLLAEDRTTVLHGPMTEALVPLLAGHHTRSEVTSALAAAFPGKMVSRQLDKLLATGLVVDSAPVEDVSTAAYWDLSGVNAGDAERQLSRTTVTLTQIGEAHASYLAEALVAGGVTVAEGDRDSGLSRNGNAADYRVVVTDSLRAEELLAVNDEARQSTTPWCVVKLSGPTAFLSPQFISGKTACWKCVAHRLAGSAPEAAYVESTAGNGQRARAVPVGGHLVTQLTARWVSLQIIRWIAGVTGAGSAVTAFDTLSLQTRHHAVTRRPQCSSCGDPGLVRAHASAPVVLAEGTTRSGADGRMLSPDAFLSAYGHLVSPLTGIVSDISSQRTGADSFFVCTAGHNFSLHGPSIRKKRGALRGQSAGKGDTLAEAQVGALGEAIERYSAVWQGDEPRIRASLGSLAAEGKPFVHPNEIQLFSERQYGRCAEQGSSGPLYHTVPVRFDPDRSCDWTPVWSLTRQCTVYVPTGALYYRYPHDRGRAFIRADSNGSAAGGNLTEAVFHGLLELIERDGVALWWYNRVARPEWLPGDTNLSHITEWRTAHARLGREAWILDITSDLGVPTAVAVSRLTGSLRYPGEGILMGFGADPDPAAAAAKAMKEANQLLAAVDKALSDVPGRTRAGEDELMVNWWRTARLSDHPYLYPLSLTGSSSSQAPSFPPDDVTSSQVDRLRSSVERHGMEVLIANQTRPDIGLPVAKVIVPGLRHFWPRYAPGRLYDVPVRLGWLKTPTFEEDLNPVGMFL